MSATWVDSHCHLQERYVADDPEGAMGALERARLDGVSAVVCVGTDEQTSRQAVELATAVALDGRGAVLPAVRAVIGLHPHEASQSTSWIEPLIDEVGPAVVGIGECGLDYHYEHSPRLEQQRSFAEQIALAHRFERTLVIHARDAWDDLFAILETEGVPSATVLHCFTGGPREAERCVEAGMTVSFSGIATFKNAGDVREAVAMVPLAQMLIETDSPFLTPVPHRGEPNEPRYVPLVGAAVAEAAGVEPAVLAEATAANAARLFGI